MPSDDAEARTRIRSFLEPITMIALALLMIANILPRNAIFGVRTRETLASDAAWVTGNRIGGLALVFASVLWLLAAFYLPRRYVRTVGVTAVFLVFVLLFLVQGWSF